MSSAHPEGTSSSDRIANVDATLTTVIGQLENEAAVKKSIRESLEPIEEFSRSALTELNKLHSAPAKDRELPAVVELASEAHTAEQAICERCLATIAKAHPLWTNVSTLIPKGEFYRYSFAIGPLCRSFVTSIAFARFILHDELVPAFTAANLMGLGGDDSGELQLTADDYLQGVIGMVNELPRLSINAVTAQNFTLPVKIAAFVNDVFQSYSLLNLRNDQLRRRFDSLKYDLKRCEDVVYDLTLRGLTSTTAEAGGAAAGA